MATSTKARAKVVKVLSKKKAIATFETTKTKKRAAINWKKYIGCVWKKYIGCVGWFNEKGRFVLVPNLKAFRMHTKSEGPDFYLMSVLGPDLLISPNAFSIHIFPKKFSKILI